MNFPPAKGTLPEVSWLPCEALQADEAYQRSLDHRQSKKLIEKIAHEWDWRLCAPLTISHRDDDDGELAYFVIDGQHRLAAAELRGDIPDLPCIISVFESFEAEALAFVNINSARRQVTALDKFHARVAAKEELALKVKALVEEAGLKITRHNDAVNWKVGEIAFPDLVGSRLLRSRKTCADALGVLSIAYTAPLLRGADLFVGVFSALRTNSWGASTQQRLAEHIGKTRQSNWIERARRVTADKGWSSDTAMAHVLLQEFTKPSQIPPSDEAKERAAKAAQEPSADLNIRLTTEFGTDNKVWCDQCERRVDKQWIRLCMSKFCKAKAATV